MPLNRSLLLITLALAAACGEPARPASSVTDADVAVEGALGDGAAASVDADEEAGSFMSFGSGSDAAGPRKAHRAAQGEVVAGRMIAVEASKVLAGSPPGSPGRDPGAEMDNEAVPVPAFEIDLLPWPNDPSKAPLTEVDQQRAAALCEQAGKRLCHELEWELACEGPEAMVYPGGDEYDEALYREPLKVAAASGARAMGTIEEWTQAEFGGDARGVIALRGSPLEGAGAATRRCAHRAKAEPGTARPGLGFRCCRGPAPSLEYKTATYRPPFDRLELTTEEFQAMIRSIPELRRIHDDPTPFTREDLYRFRAKAGLSGSVTDIGAITWKAIRWVPTNGEEIVVATGRDGRDSFVVALYELPGKVYSHAASYILVGDRDPCLLAYTKNPRHIRWLPCLDCADGGLLTIDEETGLVDISQRW